MADTMSSVTRDFLADTLDPARFGHADHVRVAWDLLGRHEFLAAADLYVRGIAAIAGRAGVPQKVNLTITLAFLSLIAERMAACPGQDFDAFAADHPDLMRKDLLAGWYSDDRLRSDTARRLFLLPDACHAPSNRDCPV